MTPSCRIRWKGESVEENIMRKIISAKRREMKVIGDDSYLFPTLRNNDNNDDVDDVDDEDDAAEDDDAAKDDDDDDDDDNVYGTHLFPAVGGEVEDKDSEEGDAHARYYQVHLEVKSG